MIVLDASALVAFLDASDHHHDAAASLLTEAVDEGFGINPLTLAEVLVGPLRLGRKDAAFTALRRLDVRELPFPADTAVRLAQLRVDSGLRMPDCCVLLAALDTGGLATFDGRLAAAARGAGVNVLGA